MATVFFSYSHADEAMRDQLEKHLSGLKRQGIIEAWHDRRIAAGDHIDHSIDRELERADVILLLVSPDFPASDYCHDVEMGRAMERHGAGEARVIPVILRHCDWHGTPFGKLLATPKDGRPIKAFPDLDEGFLQVVLAIKAALPRGEVSRPAAKAAPTNAAAARSREAGPRSSNLRLPRRFTEADLDRFRDEAFDYIAKFFENSLAELEARNAGVEGRFKRIDAHRFTAVVYIGGRKRSFCHVFLGQHPDGVAYSSSEALATNGFNECLTVEADADGMFLRPIGMAVRDESGRRLTFHGAAEAYWDLFIEPLRR